MCIVLLERYVGTMAVARKSYWQKFKSLFASQAIQEPVVHPAAKYGLSNKLFSPATIMVLDTLRQAGFAAYVVGGGVRDLLLKLKPKDFDVVTDAHPEEVQQLFKHSRIIGKRFQLVHIRHRGELIEVSTFRAHKTLTNASVAQMDGTPQSDNEFGSLEEDAWRRDFPINALYYDHLEHNILDFTGGMLDIQKRKLRVIGDPTQRFHEDPVRILRAIRLAAKLGFNIEHSCEMAIYSLSHLLHQVPPSRLFDELLKLLFHGYAEKTYACLQKYDCFKELFPDVASVLQEDIFFWDVQQFIKLALRSTDTRVQQKMGINPGFMLAVFLWPVFIKKTMSLSDKEANNRFMLRHLVHDVLMQQKQIFMLPKRFLHMIQEVWFLQYNLEMRRSNKVLRVAQQRHFRAAVDFLELRASCGEPVVEVANWWRSFRTVDKERQQEMLQELREQQGKKKLKRKKKKKNAN